MPSPAGRRILAPGTAHRHRLPATLGSPRARSPHSTNSLFFAALLAHKWGFLRYAQPRDWLNFLLGCLRHPQVSLAILRVKQQQAEFWHYLNRITAERTAEAATQGFSALADDTVLDKQRPLPS